MIEHIYGRFFYFVVVFFSKDGSFLETTAIIMNYSTKALTERQQFTNI